MYRGKSVAVVIPAYNEEALIGETLLSIPEYVDNVYAVDDCSNDQTGEYNSPPRSGKPKNYTQSLERKTVELERR